MAYFWIFFNMLEITHINIYVVKNHKELWHGVQNPFYVRPMTSIFSMGQISDGSGFYSRQIPHYVELNRDQIPRGCPGGGGGGGMIALDMYKWLFSN